jgi:hypothetical protein
VALRSIQQKGYCNCSAPLPGSPVFIMFVSIELIGGNVVKHPRTRILARYVHLMSRLYQTQGLQILLVFQLSYADQKKLSSFIKCISLFPFVTSFHTTKTILFSSDIAIFGLIELPCPVLKLIASSKLFPLSRLASRNML